MDREEDIQILREHAADLQRNADNTSLKVAQAASRAEVYKGKRAENYLQEADTLRLVHRRQVRRIRALNNAIAAYIEE